MQGKNFVLSFENDIGSAIQKACKHDDYSHANTVHLVWAARLQEKKFSSLSIHVMDHLQKNASKM